MQPTVLAFDVGGTKTAWGLVTEDGTLHTEDTFPTPSERDVFLTKVREIIDRFSDVHAVGIGIAGTVSPDHKHTLVCPNIPGLSHLDLANLIGEELKKPVAIDNDGRCALIGEAWLGAAQDISSAVLITLGTGVGGAVMQRKTILAHPTDISLEISHLPADPDDLYPAPSGRGTVEALIGGRNIEERYGISLGEMSTKAAAGDPEALEFWDILHHSFMQCIRAIHGAYGCSCIFVGGRGVRDLALYLGNETPPCPVSPAKLGPKAGLLGAARIAWDAAEEEAKDWDEE